MLRSTLQPKTLQPKTLQPKTLQPKTLQPKTLLPKTLQQGPVGRSARSSARLIGVRSVVAVAVAVAATALSGGGALPAGATIPSCDIGFEPQLVDTYPLSYECVPVAEIPPYYDGPVSSSADPMVITLGDSYSSGTGIHTRGSQYDEEFGGYQSYRLHMNGRADEECWREDDGTPGPRLAQLRGVPSVFLACKGAEADHVADQISVLRGRFPQAVNNGFSGSVIAVTAGGNDLRTFGGRDWPSLLRRCITQMFGQCSDSPSNLIANFGGVKQRLVTLYASLAQTAPNAQIRVLGYPLIANLANGCPGVLGLSASEAFFIDGLNVELNQRIATAVAQVKSSRPAVDIEFVGVTSLFNTGACSITLTPLIRGIVLAGLSTSDASFHPTIAGYNRYFQALQGSL